MKHSASTLRQIVLSVLTVFLLVFSAVSAYTLCTPEQDERVPLTSSQSSELSGDRRGDASEVSATARRRGVENILICGKDRASGLCDVIIVARLDTSNHSASLVQIPRDTYAAYTEKSFAHLCQRALDEDRSWVTVRRRGYGEEASWPKRAESVLQLLRTAGLL